MDVNIPGFTVISVIGKGGMATVYLAYQRHLERRVALKVLSPELAVDPVFCERFLRESRMGANLFHRNIVPVYDGGIYKTHHYLVMEYLPNSDFKYRMQKGCDVATVLRVVYEVACALAYAHTKSYVHRDIKPENILFREDNSAVLTDFGVAVDVMSDRNAALGKQIVGSPQYMSPEQAQGAAADFRADVYSLGAVLYEALAGAPLLPSTTTVEDAVRHGADPAPRLPAEVSWLQPVLDRMLAKDRRQRFTSMGEVVKALEPCLAVPVFQWGEPRNASQRDASAYSPSSPTLVVNMEQKPVQRRVEAKPAVAPSSVAPSPIKVAPIKVAPSEVAPVRHRSRVGALLVLLGLAALPLGYGYWPAISGALQAMIAQPLDAVIVSAPSDRVADMSESVAAAESVADVKSAVVDASASDSVSALVDASASDSGHALASEPLPGAETALESGFTQEFDANQVSSASGLDAVVEATPADLAAQEDLAQMQLVPAPELAATVQADEVSDYEKFTAILEQDPENPVALNGLSRVVAHYLDLASAALNRDNLEGAQRYMDQASLIVTRHSMDAGLSQRIADMQYVLNRIRVLDEQRNTDSGTGSTRDHNDASAEVAGRADES